MFVVFGCYDNDGEYRDGGGFFECVGICGIKIIILVF